MNSPESSSDELVRELIHLARLAISRGGKDRTTFDGSRHKSWVGRKGSTTIGVIERPDGAISVNLIDTKYSFMPALVYDSDGSTTFDRPALWPAIDVLKSLFVLDRLAES